jgi:hypothetical protein
MDLTAINPFVWGIIGVIAIIIYLVWAYFTGKWPF